ncbi:MAG: universal stress protein [Betaproteobacteria bacterium]|jgi:nucleotide-binding universal stress UspA family protein|nr:MAG: universal stress protein [Betaproteobacteria bacterium]TMH31233.1 MAG: universal stress protein [Betaproteobacteria bacterium]
MYRRILVPIDGSATSTRGLTEAIKLAKLTGARIKVVHVVDEISFATSMEAAGTYSGEVAELLRESGEKILQHAKSRVAKNGLRVDAELFDSFAGRVCDLVVDAARAWRADLIVLGTHGRRGIGRLMLGSDAELIVRSAPVPVLLVRAAESRA